MLIVPHGEAGQIIRHHDSAKKSESDQALNPGIKKVALNLESSFLAQYYYTVHL